MQNLCYHCMKQRGDSSVCPHCRHDVRVSAAAPYHLRPGTVLNNRYLIGEALGEGGFGITYIGLDQNLSKRVAVKEFYPSGAANRTAVLSDSVLVTRGKEEFFRKGADRFLLEAKNVAEFSEEDGIVDVLEHFRENNTAYIVMEYLDGETLKDHINRRGTFQANELITLMLPVMQSLSVMHRKHIIHRDISPDNIMLTKNGKLKLMDFGSARFYTNNERDMSVVLKQGFAPEEQYHRDGTQGPFTDVYALCATIYTCITGIVPPDSPGRLKNDTLRRPSQLDVTISKTQEEALLHGLAPDAAARCPDMDSLMREFAGNIDANATKNANDERSGGTGNYIGNHHGNYIGNRSGDFNDRYHDDFTRRQQQGYIDPNRRNSSPPPKNNAPIIAAIIITTVAILAVGGVIIYLLLTQNDGADDRQSEQIGAVVSVESSQQTSVESSDSGSSSDIDSSSEIESSSSSQPPTELPPNRQKRLNDITDMFVEDNSHMSEAQSGGAYDYVLQENGRIWVGTKDSFYDTDEDKTWYFFDSNHELYFVYDHTPQGEYRYYVYKDTVFKYTIGAPTEEQIHYTLPEDSLLRTDAVQGVVADAYSALNSLY